jgi:hypothetical protein
MGSAFRLLSRVLACVGILFGVTACHSADPNYASTLVGRDFSPLASTETGFLAHYSSGEWMPSLYATSDWEKYQSAAAGEATLGALPGGTQVQRQVAIDTVNRAIRVHQMSNGDFDNGTTASGTSGVQGSFWAAAEGQIALELKPFLDAGTLASWTTSMEHYVDYLSSSGNLLWYANGNMALRHALIALETKLLSGSSTYAQYYSSAIQSTLDPTMGGALPAWAPYGLKFSKAPTQADGSDGSGWLFESANGGHPDQVPVCANGMNPCNGFDPHYTMVQLGDALTGYAISDDPQWLRLVNLETNQLMPLVDHSTWMLNASNGSRDNIRSEPLYPLVLGVFDEHNLRSDLSPAINWPRQLQPVDQEFAYFASLSNPGPDNFALVAALAIPLIDAQRTEAGPGTATTGPGTATTGPGTATTGPGTATTGPGTAAAPPASTRPGPVVSGTAMVGHVLSVSTGSWSGAAAISFAYRWERCHPACAIIAGAARPSYRLLAPDEGGRVRVVVTASNPVGSASVASPQVGPVAAAGPTVAQIKARLLTEITPHGRAPNIKRLLKKRGYALLVDALGAGNATIDWYLAPRAANIANGPKPVLIAIGHKSFVTAGIAKITIRLTTTGRRLLKHAKTLKLTAKASFRPTGTTAIVAYEPFTLTR